MLKIKETIVVEGRYDKNKLSQIVDATVIEIGGFRVFKRGELKSLIKRIAETSGIIILTDSDSAGFLIRNHLKGILPNECVKNAYIPRINGKERRKKASSKEGLLGVEGVPASVITDALIKAGATVVGESEKRGNGGITKLDFYNDGLSGKSESRMLRQKLATRLDLPAYMSSNSLLEAVNILLSYDEYKSIAYEVCHD